VTGTDKWARFAEARNVRAGGADPLLGSGIEADSDKWARFAEARNFRAGGADPLLGSGIEGDSDKRARFAEARACPAPPGGADARRSRRNIGFGPPITENL
jgi:hypothetical protein